MLNNFYNSISDNKIVLQNNSNSITWKQIKQLVSANITKIETKKENVVLSTNNILDFTINFFSSVFSNKNIYLVDEINKLKHLNIEYDILDTIDYKNISTKCTFPQKDENKIFIHLLTSGSTGNAKCITKSLTNLINEANDIKLTFKFPNTNMIVSTTTTFSHLYGLTFGFMFPLCNNYTINLDTIDYPDTYNITNSILVSTPSVLDILRKNNIIINSQYIISAGAKLKDETFSFLESFTNVIEIYGSTETGVIAHREHAINKTLTLFKNVKIEVKEDTAILQTPYAYEDKVIINDKIELDQNQIILKNRTDRLLKIQEKRVSAEKIEKDLSSHELIEESYCFKNNDKIACLVALSAIGKQYIIDEGIFKLTKKLKLYLKNKNEIIPQKWKYIDEIPKTKAGKIDIQIIQHIFNINLSLPIILQREINKDFVSFKLFMHKSCNFYSGHFPDYPITPGVVQLYIATFLGEYYFKKKITGGQHKKIKFTNIIEAGNIITLELQLKEKNVAFEYKNKNQTFSQGLLACENIFEGVNE